MKVLVTDQRTAAAETALCNTCYKNGPNRSYAKEMASQSDDIPTPYKFIDANFNDALQCCICGKYAFEEAKIK